MVTKWPSHNATSPKNDRKKHLWTALPSSCQRSLSPGTPRQCNKHVFHKKRMDSNLKITFFQIFVWEGSMFIFRGPIWIYFTHHPGFASNGQAHYISLTGGGRHLTSSDDFAKLDEIWILSRCRSPKIQQTVIGLGCFGALLGCRNWLCKICRCRSMVWQSWWWVGNEEGTSQVATYFAKKHPWGHGVKVSFVAQGHHDATAQPAYVM